MEVVRDWRNVPPYLRGAVVALGNFDGVHRGHRKVIGIAQALAAEAGAAAGVISFAPHPRRFFAPDRPFFRLTPQPLKLRLLEALGVDVTFVVTFDAALAAMSPADFVSRVLVEGLGLRHVIAGWNFRFGAKRAGDAAALEKLAHAHGVGVTIVRAEEDAGGLAFSSTRVRDLLAAGKVREAAATLGWRWRLVGTVIGGEGRGRGLGFPTINIRLDPSVALAHGIYAVQVVVGGETHDGAAYFGTRPTFGGTEPFLEVFLLDFEGDLYGREVEIAFVDHLRGDRAFESAEALAAQIAHDCAAARARLAELGAGDPLNSQGAPCAGPRATERQRPSA